MLSHTLSLYFWVASYNGGANKEANARSSWDQPVLESHSMCLYTHASHTQIQLFLYIHENENAN